MRRLLVSIAITVLVASSTTAFAASLGLRPLALSAASVPVGPCDRDGVTVAYRLAWRGHVVVDRVAVSGIADRCVGRRLTAVLVVDGHPVDLGTVTVRRTRPDDSEAVLIVHADVRATAAETVHLSIT